MLENLSFSVEALQFFGQTAAVMTQSEPEAIQASDQTYYLIKGVLGKTPKIAITAAEYREIIAAQKAIGVVLDIEEAWDEIIQNYLELELEIVGAATHHMITGIFSPVEFSRVRSQISRRVSNLLQSCRAYLDHTSHHLSGVDATNELHEKFKAMATKEYDSNFGYRFMEALRNYAQHRGVPMHGLTLSSRWISEGDDIKHRGQHSAAGRVNLVTLRGSGDFKKGVLSEIPNDKKYLDISTLTREYMERLSTVHTGLRNIMRPQFERWTQIVRDTIQRYDSVNDGNTLGLAAIMEDQGSSIEQQTDIFLEPVDQIDLLTRRNRDLTNLSKRHASSQILPAE